METHGVTSIGNQNTTSPKTLQDLLHHTNIGQSEAQLNLFRQIDRLGIFSFS